MNAQIDYINNSNIAPVVFAPASSHKSIFVTFITRSGMMSAADAAAEFDFIGDMSMNEYLMARRIGMGVALSRADRASVYMTFENALNHASFAA